jgi:hypothetical protein
MLFWSAKRHVAAIMEAGCGIAAARHVHRLAGMRGCVRLIVVSDQQMRVDTLPF